MAVLHRDWRDGDTLVLHLPAIGEVRVQTVTHRQYRRGKLVSVRSIKVYAPNAVSMRHERLSKAVDDRTGRG